jgi:excinuclease ABC subunit C
MFVSSQPKRYRTDEGRSIHVRGGGFRRLSRKHGRRCRRRIRLEAEETESPAISDDASEWRLPDLFVVDGGRCQLGVALAAAHELGSRF